MEEVGEGLFGEAAARAKPLDPGHEAVDIPEPFAVEGLLPAGGGPPVISRHFIEEFCVAVRFGEAAFACQVAEDPVAPGL